MNFARSADDADILEGNPESVKTGRTIDDLEGEAPGWSSKTGQVRSPTAEHKSTVPPRRAPNPLAIEGSPKPPCPARPEQC